METMIHMLHLEDDPADAELVQARLAEAGLACRITRAQTRAEFETGLGDGRTDIILADYRLPTYDGMSALRLAHERFPELPFIFVSGAMGEEAAIEALTQGATDYVLKQNLSRLAPAVRRALQEARNQRERRQAQEALQRSNEMLRAIIEAVPVAIIGLDLDGHVHSVWNPAAEKMLGWRGEEVMGRPLPTVPADRQDEFSRIQEQIHSGMTLNGVEARRQRRDGTVIDYSIYASPLHDAQGRISGNIAVLVDITERKRAEASIRKLSQAIEQSPVSIVITDVAGSIEFVNAKFTQLTGYTCAEALGQNPRILKSGETPVEEYRRLWKTIGSGGVWRGEFHNRKKSGELFWEQATIAPVRDANKVITHYVAVKEDITERKRLEDLLRQVQKMEAIGQLAGGIAHDFNNILSAITGYTEISKSIIEPESKVSEYLAHVLEASGRAKELINQILMFSRETEKELRPIQVALPVKEAVKLIRASVPATIEIRFDIQSKASALADPTQIHQIVMNLCTNAAQAMQEKGGLLDVRLTDITIDQADNLSNYPDAKPGGYIRLTVSDQGCGIAAHHLHRIFDPFFTTKAKGEGTGMGLSVVHGIVKSFGGLIYVHSRLGEGATFEVLIPALERPATADPGLEKPAPMGSESILFVDDETMIVDIVKRMLESLGYHVVARTSAIEALEAFRKHPDSFDLVVTDMIMPKMSGLDLAQKILRIRPGLPIVLCTGFGANLNEEKITSQGVRNIIYKPILRRDMATAVRKALDGR